LILDTIRARFTALINWAASFLFREPLRLDVTAQRRQRSASSLKVAECAADWMSSRQLGFVGIRRFRD